MDTRPILFDHLPKTGGLAVHALLQSALGAERCSPVITGSIYDARAAYERFDAVSGHFYFHPHTDLSDLWTMTLLRHPVERFVSHFLYAQLDVGPSGGHMAQVARSGTVDDYVASDDPQIVATFSNIMVQHFALLGWDGVAELTPEHSLNLARAALERFDLVGLTERMNETADLLCHARGWSPVREVPFVNTSMRRLRPDEIAPVTRARLGEHNALDLELYAHARKLYDRARQRVIFSDRGTVAAEITHPPSEAGPPVWPAGLKVAPPPEFGSREAEIVRIDVYAQSGAGPLILSGELASMRVVFRAQVPVEDLTVGIHVRDARLQTVFATNTRHYGFVLAASSESECVITLSMRIDLGPGRYWVGASLHPSDHHIPKCFHWTEALAPFDVVGKLGWHFEGATKLYPDFEFAGVRVARPAGSRSSPQTQFLGRVPPMLTDFRQRIAVSPIPDLQTNQLVAQPVEVTNAGCERWPSMGERSVHLSYHWHDHAGEIVVFDGERTLLPRDLNPGEGVGLWASIRAPEKSGQYTIVWSLVQETVGWFMELGSDAVTQAVMVIE